MLIREDKINAAAAALDAAVDALVEQVAAEVSTFKIAKYFGEDEIAPVIRREIAEGGHMFGVAAHTLVRATVERLGEMWGETLGEADSDAWTR